MRLVRPRGPLEWLARLIRLQPFHCQLCRRRFRAFYAGSRVAQDRRCYDRIPVLVPVFFEGPGIEGRGLLIDVSMGGAWISSEHRPDLGQTLVLDLYDSEQDLPIRIDGAVVRVTVGRGFACEFVRMEREHEARLQRLVERSWSVPTA